MNKPKHWLNEAKQLCDEIGPEDGVDPRVLAHALETTKRSHTKQTTMQRGKNTLSLVLTGEVSDPALQNIEVIDITANEDGQFLFVSVAHIASGVAPDEKQMLNKLKTIQGYLRSAIAQSVKRKRVPALKFQLVLAANKVDNYAYSKHINLTAEDHHPSVEAQVFFVR